MLKRIVKTSFIFGAIVLSVGVITYLAVSSWKDAPGGTIALIVAIMTGFLAIFKDLIAILKDMLEIQEMNNKKELTSSPQKASPKVKKSVPAREIGGRNNSDGKISPPLFELRNLLANKFDDPEFDAFCQDNFFNIYNKFGRGMRKDEKINMLLDYCNRDKPRMKQLLKAIEWDNK